MKSVFRSFFFSIVLCAIPATALAEQAIKWNFEGGRLPTTWDVRRLTNPRAGTEGLVIQTNEEGFMTTDANFLTSIDALRLNMKTKQSMEVTFLWRNPKVAGEHYVHLPFIVHANEDFQDIEIDLSLSAFWNHRTDVVGFAFPKGTDLTIKSVEFLHWNLLEKMIEGWKSFWTFDTFNPHSINFIWGPFLTFNPIARNQMHATDPPWGISGMYAFYTFLTVAALGCFLGRKRCRRIRAILLFFLIFAGCWVIYDLRMGAEFLGYVQEDWETYVTRDMGERLFREHKNFHDIAQYTAVKVHKKYPMYLFIGPERESIYLTAMRYYSFPSIPVLFDGTLPAEETTALIYHRDDITLNEDGHLVQNGELLFGNDQLLQQFDPHSFLVKLSP